MKRITRRIKQIDTLHQHRAIWFYEFSFPTWDVRFKCLNADAKLNIINLRNLMPLSYPFFFLRDGSEDNLTTLIGTESVLTLWMVCSTLRDVVFSTFVQFPESLIDHWSFYKLIVVAVDCDLGKICTWRHSYHQQLQHVPHFSIQPRRPVCASSTYMWNISSHQTFSSVLQGKIQATSSNFVVWTHNLLRPHKEATSDIGLIELDFDREYKFPIRTSH